MALKSSQPRRSELLKSARPILRTTNEGGGEMAVPNAPGSGFAMLSEYCVAMAAVSLARAASVSAARLTRLRPHVRKLRSSPARQTKFNEKGLCRTKPVATCTIRLARLKQNIKVSLTVG